MNTKPIIRKKGMLHTKVGDMEIIEPLIGMKATRESALSKLTIEISTGKIFDGDSDSLSKLQRALEVSAQHEILTGVPISTTVWRLNNNIPTEVTIEEIREAFVYGSLQYSVEFLKY